MSILTKELNKEIKMNIELINIAIKAQGYNVAKAGVFLIDKFVALLPKEEIKTEEVKEEK